MRRHIAFASVAFTAITFVPSDSIASPELRRAEILSTMIEAALASVALLHDASDGGEVETIDWVLDYSDRDWLFNSEGSIRGHNVQLTMAGYVWGAEGEDNVVTYSGLGRFSEQELRVHGQTIWYYNEESEDYFEMDFRHVMRIGENTFWGWVLGAETLVGGTIGAGAAIAGSAVATGGAALGAAPWIGAGGAVAGGSALVGASAAAKTLLQSDEPVPPPDLPERAVPPDADEELFPKEGMIYFALSQDGRLVGSGPDGIHVLVGNYSNAEGFAEGQILVANP